MAIGYRQQTGLGLGSALSCPSCTGSYKATVCGGGVTYYLDKTSGWVGSSASILANTYVAGNVVWIKQGSTGTIYCAEIDAIVSDPPGPYRIDEAANSGTGPYANCASCIVP